MGWRVGHNLSCRCFKLDRRRRGGGRSGHPAALAGFPSEVGNSRSWTFPRSGCFHRPLQPPFPPSLSTLNSHATCLKLVDTLRFCYHRGEQHRRDTRCDLRPEARLARRACGAHRETLVNKRSKLNITLMSKTQTLLVSWGIRLGSIALVAILNFVIAGLTNGSVQLPVPAALDPILGSLLAEFVDWLVPYEGTATTAPPSAQ